MNVKNLQLVLITCRGNLFLSPEIFEFRKKYMQGKYRDMRSQMMAGELSCVKTRELTYDLCVIAAIWLAALICPAKNGHNVVWQFDGAALASQEVTLESVGVPELIEVLSTLIKRQLA